MDSRQELHRRLAAEAAAGSIESRNELCVRLYGLCVMKAKRFARGCFNDFGGVVDSDDFAQEAAVALLVGIKGYRPDRGAEVSTFAAMIAVRGMRGAVRKELRHHTGRGHGEEHDVELVATARAERMSDAERETVLIVADAAGARLEPVTRRAIRRPSKHEGRKAEMAALHSAGVSLREIARRFCTNHCQVSGLLFPCPQREPRNIWKLRDADLPQMRTALAELEPDGRPSKRPPQGAKPHIQTARSARP